MIKTFLDSLIGLDDYDTLKMIKGYSPLWEDFRYEFHDGQIFLIMDWDIDYEECYISDFGADNILHGWVHHRRWLNEDTPSFF